MEINEGGCLCGAVRFKTRGKLRELIFCHCSQCRKQTGLYYAATNVLDREMEVEGVENVTWYRSAMRRDVDSAGIADRPCSGRRMDWTTRPFSPYIRRVGGARARLSLFCADKGHYYDISDDLPRFAGSRP